MFCRLVLIGVFAAFISCVYSKLYMKTVNIECEAKKKYFYENYTCRLKAINRFKTIGMMQIHPRVQLRNISFNFGVFIRNDVNIFKPSLINITSNLCQWYDNRSPGFYKTTIIKILKRFTNMNHSCPYTGPLIARDFYLDLSILPVKLLVNSYKFKIVFYEGVRSVNEHIGTVIYYMDLIESRK